METHKSNETINETLRLAVERLGAVQEEIRSVSSQSEHDFLDLGEKLNKEYGSITAFTQKALEAVSFIGGHSDDSAFSKVESIVNSSLTEIRSSHEAVFSKIDHIKSVTGYLNELAGKRSRIETLVKHLNAIGFNMMIESARSEKAAGEFTIIAKDIRHLSEGINDIVHAIRDNSEEAGAMFLSAHKTLAEDMQKLQNYTGEAEESVQNSVRKTGQIMKIAFDTVEQAGTRSREITRQVEKIVIGVQLHDSMRQRLEHIASALGDAEQKCRSDQETGGMETPITEHLSFAHAVVSLQSEQLKHIVGEVGEVYDKNKHAFDSIINEVGSLSTNLSGAISGGGAQEVTCHTDDPFTVLTVTLMNIQNLQDQVNQLLEEVKKTFLKASETAAQLSDHAEHVHEISLEADIKALNAMIAAQRLGDEGRTMAVLAQEMKALSTQSEIFVTDVEETINVIADSVSTPEGGATESTSVHGISEGVETSRESMDSMISTIFGIYESMKTEAMSLSQRAEEIQSELTGVSESLVFFNTITNALGESLGELTEIRTLLDPWVDESTIRAEDLEVLNRYTMEKEREIHQLSLTGVAEAAAEPGDKDQVELFDEPDSDSGGDDDLGDNVDLF